MVAILCAAGLLERITGGVAELGRLTRAAAAGLAPAMRLAALSVGGRHDADRLRARLRLSRQEHAQLTDYADTLADLHGRARIEAGEARALAAVHGLQLVKDTLVIMAGEPRPDVTEAATRALQALGAEGRAPAFPLAGADLVAAGVRPGPAIGRGLDAARQLWLEEGCPAGQDARARLLERALAGAGDT